MTISLGHLQQIRIADCGIISAIPVRQRAQSSPAQNQHWRHHQDQTDVATGHSDRSLNGKRFQHVCLSNQQTAETDPRR